MWSCTYDKTLRSRNCRGSGIGEGQRAGLARDARASPPAMISSSPPASPEAGQLSQSTRPLALNGPAKLSPRKLAVRYRSVNVFGSGN